jgi:hypothetical protein
MPLRSEYVRNSRDGKIMLNGHVFLFGSQTKVCRGLRRLYPRYNFSTETNNDPQIPNLQPMIDQNVLIQQAMQDCYRSMSKGAGNDSPPSYQSATKDVLLAPPRADDDLSNLSKRPLRLLSLGTNFIML